ncbi:MAG: hypothetical protein M1815_000418 [Lichina confinis]|nr:MAG: hypothetical protein M1815_000418 [Lichina confinis]
MQEEMTPDSTKSTQQKVKESVTDTADRIARGAQSDDSKSAGQATFDQTQRANDREVHGSTPQSMLDKAKNAVGMGAK